MIEHNSLNRVANNEELFLIGETAISKIFGEAHGVYPVNKNESALEKSMSNLKVPIYIRKGIRVPNPAVSMAGQRNFFESTTSGQPKVTTKRNSNQSKTKADGSPTKVKLNNSSQIHH